MNMLWFIDKHQSEAQKLLQLLNSIHLSYQMLKNKGEKKEETAKVRWVWASTTCFSPLYVLCMIGILLKMGSLQADKESLVTHCIKTATSTQVTTFIAIYSTLSNTFSYTII